MWYGINGIDKRRYVGKGAIKTAQQLQAGIDYLKGKSDVSIPEFETACGVGML